MWDEIVDVVSVGAGPGGLACAVAAVDAGLDVFVAVPGVGAASDAADSDETRGWLPVVSDAETMAYLDALAEELPTVLLPGDSAALQIRALTEVEVDTSRRAQVETFVGSRLGTWAAGCIASPYGLLFTRVDHWPTTTMRTANGKSFQVAALDESAPARSTFAGRLDALMADRDIDVFANRRLERIVFEEGRIVGVVVDSPDGPWAVRARVGIAVTSERPAPPDSRILDADSRIALVGLTASRFGRVEVLSSADVPAAAEVNSV
jgi:FAD binding domain